MIKGTCFMEKNKPTIQIMENVNRTINLTLRTFIFLDLVNYICNYAEWFTCFILPNPISNI